MRRTRRMRRMRRMRKMRSSVPEWGAGTRVMEAEPLLSLPMGPVRTLRDNRVGWIPNYEDTAPP